MYKIGELSKLSRLPVKTLRYYGQEGLLVPDYIDEETGYRYYNAGKLSDCYRIIMLKGLGFSLGEIKELLSLPKENFSRLIQAKEDELLRLKAQTEERLHLLRTFNLTVKENASMFDIIIRKSDNIRLAYRRTIVSRKEEYGTLLAAGAGGLSRQRAVRRHRPPHLLRLRPQLPHSGLMGMISGSAVANVATTGVMTIPIDRKSVV